MWKAAGGAAFTLAAALVLWGCGNVVPRGVEVVSEPPGATVELGGEKVGRAPVLIPLKRLKDHGLDTLTLVVSLEGYETLRVVLEQRDGILRVPLTKK